MKKPFNSMFPVLRSLPAVIALSLAGFGGTCAQTSGTWTSLTSGNWSDPANWAPGPVASGATFTADFSTLNITADTTVTLDSPFTIGKLLAGDLTTASHNWFIAGANNLTLDNALSTPEITVNHADPTNATTRSLTISAPLAGTKGFTKAGAGTLILSGNNSGLSGTLTIQDLGGTNNHGVVLASNNAIGGITSINIQGSTGTPFTGGFLQLDGGVTLPGTVGITLNSPGGNNFPPGGIRSSGAGTVNSINGAINVTLNNSRISNNSAQRLDINGAITGGSNTVVFRNAVNEGIHLTNIGNSWTGQTQAHEGIFWFDPGCLPANSNLIIGNSGNASIQTKGTFTRALGTGGTQVQFQNVVNGGRAGGFSARGGDLTVNLGGAGANVLFCSNPGATGNTTSASASVTNINTTNLVVGMNVSGTGIPANTTISAIPTPGTAGTITLSAAATATGTGVSLTFWQANSGRIGMNTLWLNNPTADSKLTFVNPIDLNGTGRSFQVDANTAELSGGILGNGNITKTGAGLLVVSGGIGMTAARAITVSGGTMDVSGGINGDASTVTKAAGGGTLVLSGPSNWTGGFTTAGSSNTNYGFTRVTHSEGLGPATAAKTITMRGSNMSTSVLELSGGVAIDANKTFNMSGKSFYTAGNGTVGRQFSLSSSSGTNTWAGSVAIAETGGSYGMESQTGSTLVLGADPATTSTVRNTVADSTRNMGLFGGGNFIINSKIADNGNSNISLTKAGGGTLALARADNDLDTICNFNAGTTEVVKMSNNGVASSIGTASSFNVGGVFRYTGTGDTSNRTLGLYQKGGTLAADGAGPIQLTSPSFANLTGYLAVLSAPFANGATVLTVNDASAVAVGQSVTGTNIAANTTITAIDPSARTITLSNPTSAASTTAVALTIGGADDLNRILTLDGTNAGDNLLAANLANPAGTGTLGIAKTGPGKWILAGPAKINTGSLAVQQGILELRESGIPASSASVSAGATLVLNNLPAPMVLGGPLTLDGSIRVVLPGEPAPGTYDLLQYASVAGAGSLISPFRGSTTLGATTASVTVAPGIPLTWTGAAANGNWDVKTSVNWQDGSANPETFHFLDSVTFNSTGSSQPNVNLIGEIRTTGVTVNEATADYSFTGTGFLSGTGGLVKSGAAALTLGTANTFTGGVTINGGTLRAGSNSALGANGQAITIAAGAVLDTNGSLTASRDYAATISGSGIGGAGAIVNLGADHNNGFASLFLTDNATIGGTGRWDVRPITAGTGLVDLNNKTLTKVGTNVVALVDGNLTNDGVIDINEGILTFTRMVVSGSGNVNVKSGATLRFENTTTGSWTGKPVTLDNGAVNLIGSTNFTLDAGISVTNTGTFDVASGRFLTIPQVVTGSGGIATGPGTGTVVMTGENDYAGTTQINAGTLRVGNGTATGSLGSGSVTNNGTLQIHRSDTAYVATQDISGTGAVRIGNSAAVNTQLDPSAFDSLVTLSGNNTFAGGVNIFSGGLKITNSSALGNDPKTVSMNYGSNGRPQFYLDGTGGDIIVPANISFVTSTNDAVRPAIGNLAGNNTIAGNITLQSGGGDTRVDVQGGSLTFSGQIAAGVSARSLRLAGATGTQGVLSGKLTNGTNSWNLVVLGSNTWTITGETNDFTGTTTVSGGTLLANNASGSATGTGAVTVANATFGGTGAVSGSVALNGGGILAPGASGIESLATGALALNDTSTLAIDIHTGSATCDQVLVTGNVVVADGAVVNLTLNDLGANAVLPAGTKLVVVDYTGVWDDTDIVHFNGNPVPNGSTITFGANTFTVDYSDDTLGGTAMTLTTPGVANPYTGWADSYSLVGANRAPTADPDNDGLDNGIEFVIGSNPNTKTPASDRPSGTVIGTNLVFTFKRSDASEAFDVFVEHGTTLATWPGQILVPVVDTEGPPVDVADNGPSTLDDVTVTIPMGVDSKKFARLRADIPFTP